MRVVGNNRADDAAHYQCANPVSAVHAAVAAMMVMTRRGCRVVPLNDGTAVADGAAFVHHRLRFVARTAVTDGAAFVHHRLCFVARTAVTDGAAFVHHGLRLVARTALMHGLHSLSRCAFMNGRSYMVAGTLPLHRGFHLMAGGAFLCFAPDLLGAASDTPITKEVLKKLVIRVTANIFCNFLEIVIFIPLRSCRCCDVICQCFRQLPSPDVFVVCIISAG